MFLDKQSKAKENYDKIIEAAKKSKSEDYQDYYGGSYIDDNGDLVVYIKKESIKTKTDEKNM